MFVSQLNPGQQFVAECNGKPKRYEVQEGARGDGLIPVIADVDGAVEPVETALPPNAEIICLYDSRGGFTPFDQLQEGDRFTLQTSQPEGEFFVYQFYCLNDAGGAEVYNCSVGGAEPELESWPVEQWQPVRIITKTEESYGAVSGLELADAYSPDEIEPVQVCTIHSFDADGNETGCNVVSVTAEQLLGLVRLLQTLDENVTRQL